MPNPIHLEVPVCVTNLIPRVQVWTTQNKIKNIKDLSTLFSVFGESEKRRGEGLFPGRVWTRRFGHATHSSGSGGGGWGRVLLSSYF